MTELDGPGDDGIGRLTLANPPYNALIHPVFVEPGVLKRFLADPRLKAVIVSGRGRHFCAGADPQALDDQRKDPDRLGEGMTRGKALLEMLAFAPVPVVAAIRGSCLGAGLEIALACHFRLAARHAMLGLPEVGHGLMPGFGAAVFGQGPAPRRVVIDLILSGRLVRADEGQRLGLVDRVVSAGDLGAAAGEFLRLLVGRRPAFLVRAVMEAIHAGRRLPVDEALRRETDLFCQVIRGRQP